MPSITGTARSRHSLILSVLWICKHTIRAQYGITFKEPKLECLSDGIRLHIHPIGVFFGHVYVMGHFAGNKCHLNYCSQSIQQPFFMDVPYRDGCNVRRHRSQPPITITYEVTVVVQRHPLFITAGDRAYRLKCVYRQIDNGFLTQKLNINDLPSRSLEGVSKPLCRYDVMTSMNGPILQVVNVGEPVIHKWTCDLHDYGFLVHSCVVRDHLGTEYKLVDERGCIIEKKLVPDIIYAPDYSYAYTTINAFRFADQIMVHFVCQLTFCRAVDQGCEGITPPTCYPIEFPPIHAEYRQTTTTTTTTTSTTTTTTSTTPSNSAGPHPSTPSNDVFERTYADNNSTSRGQSASSNVFKEVKIPDHSATYKSSIGIQDVYGLEITRFDEHRKRSQDYRTETISSVFDLSPNRAVEPMPSPFPANIYYAKPRFTRSDKHPPIENITVEVEAKKMLVFSSDDNERINTSSNCRHNIVDDSLCNRIIIGQAVLLAAAVLLQVTSIVVIITQRRVYGSRRLH